MSTPHRSPRLGYALAATAATLWALNGSLARFLLDDHVPPARLAQLRSVFAFAGFAVAVALVRPALLRVSRRDMPRLAFFGIVGLTGVNAFYFAAIARLDIGVALTVQYLGPLLLLLWLKIVHHRVLPAGLWGAAALSALGCFLVVGAYDPGSLDAIGLVWALAAAVTFACYLLSGEQAGQRYAPATTLVWGFGFSALFWCITQPLWTFPVRRISSPRDVAFAVYIVIGGTMIPFACIVTAVRHLPASRVAVVATLEPVLGALIAWPLLGQALSPIQIAGGLLVIGAVIWVQTGRQGLEAELAPGYERAQEPASPVEVGAGASGERS